MKKVQLFILLELLVLTLAFFDILASETARMLLLIALVLLLIRKLAGGKGLDFFLVSAAILLFLVFMLNPYFILGVVLAVLYTVVNFFARYEKRTQYTHLVLDQQPVTIRRQKSQWFGNQEQLKEQLGFSDVNLIRLFGNDIIDLDEKVLVGSDNIVLLRKIYGQTKIIVPIDVEVSLSASSLYGQVRFLGLSNWDLRNESLAIESPHYQETHKRVKLVISSLYGDVEVIRV